MGFWQDKRVVVVGGAGFIGSYLTDLLVTQQAQVTVVDNLENGRLTNLHLVRDQINFVEGDITNMPFCLSVFEGQQIVMNLAAQAPGVGHSHLNHVSLLGRNVQIGSVVLEAARQQKVERTLVVSSSCVCPDDAPVPTPEMPTFCGEPERVNSGYGWAKRYQELQAFHYAREFGMTISIVRPFNAYGGRDMAKGERSHVIPAVIERLLSDSPDLVVWGSGRQTRSFIHARDVAAGMALVTELYPKCDPVNLGHDHETSMAGLAELLMDISGIKKKLVFDTSKPEGCLRKSADMTKFRQVSQGYTPQTDLREGLREMVEAHKALL